MNLFESLITQNPMMVEVVRSLRKLAGPRLPITIAVGIIYVLCILWISPYADRSTSGPMVFLCLITVILASAASGYKTIAGEREQRSWEILAAAPVTHSQIVIGKFLGAFSLVSVAWLLLAFPALLFSATESRASYYDYLVERQQDSLQPWSTLAALIAVLLYGMFQTALTIFFSARCRRGLVAFGIVLALNIAALIIYPVMLASLFSRTGAYSPGVFYLFLDPTTLISELHSRSRQEVILDNNVRCSMCCFTYLFLAIATLYWTQRTLRYADRNMKFIGNKVHAGN